MVIEIAPRKPLPRNFAPTGSVPYKVKDGDSWESIAKANGVVGSDLVSANFKTKNPAEVNWYLHFYVGCNRTTRDGKNWIFSSSANPGLIHIPPRVRIRYTVPMRAQGQNPICWVACVAMIASYKGRKSTGIGNFTGGFDPSHSSIPNQYNTNLGWADYIRRLSDFGFVTEILNRSPDPFYIEDLLRKHGPWMLTHLASDILPGNLSPASAHAVVITGIDMRTNKVWYNNPWGTVNQVIAVDKVLLAMENLTKSGGPAVAYMP